MIIAGLLLALAAAPASVTAGELDADPVTWSGREVVVVGELVGDYSTRGDVVWVQLNDDAYAVMPLAERPAPSGTNVAVGVRMPRGLWDPSSWGEPGGHDRRGPIVAVTGVFRHNSPTDQGETFIDASEIELVEVSRAIELRARSPMVIVTGAALTVLGLAAWAVALRRSRT